MSTGNAAPPERIHEMFDSISGVYDGMNLVISGFQEPRWRHRAVGEAALQPGMAAVDVACGTGKVSADLQQAVSPGGSVIGIDVSEGMVDRAVDRFADRPGLRFEVGDALKLPLEDASCDAATIAFGMRNLPDYAAGFAEMRRVVRPGGRVVCLEISRPSSRLGQLVAGWFDNVVPLIGRVVGQGSAYGYLVQSTKAYPAPDRIAQIMTEVGLTDVRWYGMSGGMVTIHVGLAGTIGTTGHK